ncbi:SCP2 sterol-binding domain-containing protein [Thamnocephalis sphaerospora]|uniref:SCP2 sterol-binding domain-containing protein n=1 Tax=Thamnocephalis sphaerospora TaxID=78915 RepID=A0A4P9XNX0_9FUNG|nr:SCP2 sterol-binding domain-containing protein [Thamnocephalis sphaerospora]|eukprot:RKP07666.1 SCP2 sterol-binding domain-containing protein [Thamnocephalis sphaerospora]
MRWDRFHAHAHTCTFYSTVFTSTLSLDALPHSQRERLVKHFQAVFAFDIKTPDGRRVQHTLDLKHGLGSVFGDAAETPDTTLVIDEHSFADLVRGRQNGRDLFMDHKLRVRGSMTLAMKLDKIFQQFRQQSKL